jgi:threonine/homoserine/homoserine lactone efflux protein
MWGFVVYCGIHIICVSTTNVSTLNVAAKDSREISVDSRLHGATYQPKAIFEAAVVKTSNPTPVLFYRFLGSNFVKQKHNEESVPTVTSHEWNSIKFGIMYLY